MAFTWALTSSNKVRSTWTSATALSASTEAVGYPKEYINDGNKESEWRATGVSGNFVIDSGDASLDIDYIALRFSYDKIPTSVKIETSANNSAYTSIVNNYDGTVTTTTTSALTGTSRTIPVDDTTGFSTGNTVEIDDGVEDVKKYLIVNVGVNYIEIDRYPEPYDTGADVTIVPDAIILAAVAAGESKRYIKVTVTASVTASCLDIAAFSVYYVFDGSALPLNPGSHEELRNSGAVMRTFSGYAIGRMSTSPTIVQHSITIGRIMKDGGYILDWLERQGVFGILKDDGEWIEVLLITRATRRRSSADSELISRAETLTLEEV